MPWGMEKEMEAHSSILPWEIPWTEEHGRLQSMRSQMSWTLSNSSNKCHKAWSKQNQATLLFPLQQWDLWSWDWGSAYHVPTLWWTMWLLETKFNVFGFKGMYVLRYAVYGLRYMVCSMREDLQFTPFVLHLILSSLSDTVALQISHLFDNESTLFFAIFMGIWGK